MAVDGWTDPAFAGVRDAFAANFEAGLELGASLAVSVDGELVVDLWGGHLDAARTRPWARDSLVCVFSCTKGAVAIATMWAVARGLVDLDAPVASYWPEFAAEGKGTIPVRWLLTHEAALPAVAQRLPLGSLSDWEVMTSALAAQALQAGVLCWLLGWLGLFLGARHGLDAPWLRAWVYRRPRDPAAVPAHAPLVARARLRRPGAGPAHADHAL